jgi:hypothetical protein
MAKGRNFQERLAKGEDATFNETPLRAKLSTAEETRQHQQNKIIQDTICQT